ncbi:uncharacterized protein LOC110823721 isoform X2 [Carica papaya]|uniref:uncharacterized protein LOC110823721 isoform X2 n=1 Tax=Carica papaya TaxID=3649 RepID=UPI000B8CCECF|nr:uncharacterized protein LOC110823721 isoform X2 [Carica papaya]
MLTGFISTPENCDNSLTGSDKKQDLSMEAPDQQLSVFDLLSDDGPDGGQGGSPVFEAHVAFSVEGLGKVGIETPRHSPKQPERILSYQCSSPWKAARPPNSSKNFSYILDDLELEGEAIFQDDNMPLSGSSLEFPIGVFDSCSNEMPNLYSVRDDAKYRSEVQRYFFNTKIYNIGHDRGDIWDDKPSFLDDDFVYETEHDIPWNSGSYHLDESLTDCVKYGNGDVSDHVFGCPYPLKKRDYVGATEKFNILGSPFPRHQTSENYLDFVSFGEPSGRHPNSGRTFGFEDVTNNADWSYSAAEDARDNLSLPSEG